MGDNTKENQNNVQEEQERNTEGSQPEFRDPWSDLLFGRRPPKQMERESEDNEEPKDE